MSEAKASCEPKAPIDNQLSSIEARTVSLASALSALAGRIRPVLSVEYPICTKASAGGEPASVMSPLYDRLGNISNALAVVEQCIIELSGRVEI